MNDVRATVQPYVIPDRRHYDAIVIGSGSGGLTAAVGLGRFGRHVLLIERDRMGGDCTNVGCVPSKSLLHGTRRFDGGASAAGMILKHVRSRRDELREHEIEEFGGAEGVTFVYGSGQLISSQEVVITSADGATWSATADDLILSTGSSARRVPIPGLPDDRYLTNEEIFEQIEPPQHLAIVGAGAVGLEMALAFRRLGSEVTMVEAAESVMPMALPEASAMIAESLQNEGITVHTSCLASGFDPSSASLTLRPTGDSAHDPPVVESVEKVLVAVGRIPHTEGLGLAELGVATNETGAVVVDDRGRTSVKNIWALGDMATTGGTTHFATIWGRRIIQSIVYPWLPIGDAPLRPTVVFTDPELATIGNQPDEAPADVLRITVEGSEIDRSFTDEVGHSLLVVDVRPPTGEVLGATVVSPRAGEIISTFSLAMKNDIAFHRWYGTVIPYPSYAELITVAVEKYLSELSDDVGGHTRRWAVGFGSRLGRRFSR